MKQKYGDLDDITKTEGMSYVNTIKMLYEDKQKKDKKSKEERK